MHKREAAFQTKFNYYARTALKKTAAFELKETLGPLPFSRVEDHQIAALSAARHGILVYKIPDDSRSYKPFDSFAFTKADAYVVILYRGSRYFYGIDIDDFIAERDSSIRKSLTEVRAKEICCFSDKI